MAKISVVDAAKKANMNPEEFLKKLKEYGVYAEDVQSTLDSQKISQIIKLLLTEEKPIEKKVEKRISSGIMRRRRASRVKEKASEEIPGVEEAESPLSEEPVAEGGPPESVEVSDQESIADETTVSLETETPQEGHESQEETAEAEPGEAEPVERGSSFPEAESAGTEESASGSVADQSVETGGESAVGADISGEADREAEKPRKAKKKAKPKKLPIRGVTKEPARIVALPDRKIETLKPLFPIEESERKAPVKEEPDSERRVKKGRRVVEVGRRTAGRKKKKEVYERELQSLRGKKKKRELKTTEITTPKAIKRKIKIMEEVQVGDLAHRMGIKAGDLMRKLISMGVMATINQFIDFDTAAILAEEYGFEIENISVEEDDIFSLGLINGEKGGVEESRPPVVTIMGHVDHGKTTLLDTIRETNVVKREMGGITQHIGAYNVQLESGKIVFLDTPGHETFTAMRARGAHVTDIVVLIVAADDGVMPQTIEAINHAREASVPIIVAVNKIDKPNADPDRVKNELAGHELIPEDWGGETMYAHISAKQNDGIDQLLEMILLQAEIMELKAVVDRPAGGIILEARLEKGRGPVATVLVKEGTLNIGDPIVSDIFWGRVRSMHDDRGQKVDMATPSMPVEVVGLGGVPTAGSGFNATIEERLAKQVAELREKKAREEEQKSLSKVSLEDFYTTLEEGQVKELKLIVKADVQGSVEAIIDAVQKKSTDVVKVKVIHSGAGAISETDINFAIASQAIVIGFNVRPEVKARTLAEREKIDIRLYEVIYDLVNDIEKALVGMLEPTYEETILGHVEVRDTFHISRIGTIAGCFVTDGKVVRNAKCRLIRDGVVIHKTKINSLKRFKEDAKEVQSGYECGIGLEGFNDIKIGDQIEAYEVHEVAPTLD